MTSPLGLRLPSISCFKFQGQDEVSIPPRLVQAIDALDNAPLHTKPITRRRSSYTASSLASRLTWGSGSRSRTTPTSGLTSRTLSVISTHTSLSAHDEIDDSKNLPSDRVTPNADPSDSTTARNWHYERLASRRCSRASVLGISHICYDNMRIPALRPEPDTPELAHEIRQRSLKEKLKARISSCQDLYTTISDLLDRLHTPVLQETRAPLSSLTTTFASMAHEVHNLMHIASVYQIQRLSGFWIRAWVLVLDLHERCTDTHEITLEITTDEHYRRHKQSTKNEPAVDTHINTDVTVPVHPNELIEGFRIFYFRDKVQRLDTLCAKLLHRLRRVNIFGMREHNQPVRQASISHKENETNETKGVTMAPNHSGLELSVLRNSLPPSLRVSG